jgi:hypothetical protein
MIFLLVLKPLPILSEGLFILSFEIPNHTWVETTPFSLLEHILVCKVFVRFWY